MSRAWKQQLITSNRQDLTGIPDLFAIPAGSSDDHETETIVFN